MIAIPAPRMRGFPLLATLLAALVLSAAPARSQEADPGAPSGERKVSAGEAAAALSAADSTAVAVEHREPEGPDVRSVGSGGIPDLIERRPLARLVGSGWQGHRASVARGVLPAAMTSLVVRERRVEDRLTQGLDLLAARSPEDGHIVVPSGPDLSVWPVRTASDLRGPVDLAASDLWPALSTIVIEPGRVPELAPFARLTMSTAGLGRGETALEFGRRYRDGAVGVQGYAERSEGAAPTAGGTYDIEHIGGRALAEVRGGWVADLSMMRTRLDRSTPVRSTVLVRDWVRSDASLRLSRGRSGFELFHSQAWIRSGTIGGPRGAARTTVDGLAGTLAVERPPLGRVRIEAARVAAEGSLLAAEDEALQVVGVVSGGLALSDLSLSVSAGADWLDGHAIPIGAAALGGRSTGSSWTVAAELGGRHPTAIERHLAPTGVAGDAGLAVRGDELLDPEVAAVLSAEYVSFDVLSGVGVRAELARIVGPIALATDGGPAARATNWDDETALAASVWAAVGDSARAGARSMVDVYGADDDGALVANSPVPLAAIEASTWVASRFFEGGFLEVVWELSLRHEVGLGRGPWDGTIGDSFTSLGARAGGRAGPARIFAEVRNVLDQGHERLPGEASGGRLIAAGFSWSFWD